MRFFVAGVNGQLGRDVMNELHKRGHEGVGSDIAPSYTGVDDGDAVTTMPYVSIDITDRDAVEKGISEIKPDAIIHCATWTAVDAAEDDDKEEFVGKVNTGGTPTYTFDLSRLIIDMCETEKYGYYHATNEGDTLVGTISV